MSRRRFARTFGQDLMRGEHVVGSGRGGHIKNLTWVKGSRSPQDLDDTSRKNLAAGRKTLGAIAPNERGEHGILARTGKYAARRNADKHSNLNNAPSKPPWAVSTGTENMAAGTSIFDPVLCEIVYRWFCPSGGAILDPFAGGSVRGIVAAYLGYKYTGLDLRPEQIEANEVQAETIVPDNRPRWIVGDSRNIKELAAGEYDLIFTCPPYYDLEVYSDDGRDLSTAGTYDEFLTIYCDIIAQSVAMLKDNRFAVFVVGDIRDKKGFYRGFPSHTRAAFEAAGMHLYNDAVLITAVGSLPIRVGKQFGGYRKLGKTHQNVMVFYNGNPKHIKDAFGEIEIDSEMLSAWQASQGAQAHQS